MRERLRKARAKSAAKAMRGRIALQKRFAQNGIETVSFRESF
jgi:hypothetical protein